MLYAYVLSYDVNQTVSPNFSNELEKAITGVYFFLQKCNGPGPVSTRNLLVLNIILAYCIFDLLLVVVFFHYVIYCCQYHEPLC